MGISGSSFFLRSVTEIVGERLLEMSVRSLTRSIPCSLGRLGTASDDQWRRFSEERSRCTSIGNHSLGPAVCLPRRGPLSVSRDGSRETSFTPTFWIPASAPIRTIQINRAVHARMDPARMASGPRVRLCCVIMVSVGFGSVSDVCCGRCSANGDLRPFLVMLTSKSGF